MAAGFKSFRDDASNSVLVDLTKPISQNMGWVDTNRVAGSITVPDAPNGRTFFHYVVIIESNSAGAGKRPGVTVTDNGSTVTISWNYNFQSGFGNFAANCRIHYGYF